MTADAFDPGTVLRGIHALDREAAALLRLPERAASILAEIETLSDRTAGDPPKPIDIARADNQSLGNENAPPREASDGAIWVFREAS